MRRSCRPALSFASAFHSISGEVGIGHELQGCLTTKFCCGDSTGLGAEVLEPAGKQSTAVSQVLESKSVMQVSNGGINPVPLDPKQGSRPLSFGDFRWTQGASTIRKASTNAGPRTG